MASLLMAFFLGCNAAGGFIGGLVGDWAASKWPSHGRVAVCQFSVGVGVPLSIILFKFLPMSVSVGGAIAYAVVLGITGLLITWAATACNNPIFSEIVPPESRNLVYAFDRSFEGAIAAAGAPLVGYLAQKLFHFEGSAALSDDPEQNARRARALSNALLIMTTVPWTLCCIFFSALHWSYPRDKAWAIARDYSRKRAALHDPVHDGDNEEKELQRLLAKGSQNRHFVVESVSGGLQDESNGVEPDQIQSNRDRYASDHRAVVEVPSQHRQLPDKGRYTAAARDLVEEEPRELEMKTFLSHQERPSDSYIE